MLGVLFPARPALKAHPELERLVQLALPGVVLVKLVILDRLALPGVALALLAT